MQLRKFFLLAIIYLLTLAEPILAQDIGYARSCIKTLCSDDFYGRGYVNNGDRIAAQFIKDEFIHHKLIGLGENYFQPLGYPVIYYPERVDIEFDDQFGGCLNNNFHL